MKPLTTEALLDVNIVVASIFEDHEHHPQATTFVATLDRFFTCPTTQGGFLRFATRPWKNELKVAQPPRLSMEAAQVRLREWMETPKHTFLSDNLSFTELSMRSMSGHRQWTDAYLLRLAQHHNLTLASLERRMSNLDDPVRPVLMTIICSEFFWRRSGRASWTNR